MPKVKQYTITENKDANEWLSEYRNPNTMIQMKIRLQTFIDSIDLDIDAFTKLTAKEAKHVLKKYIATTDKPNNTILSIITAPRAFFSFLNKPIKLKHFDIPKPQPAQNKHRFSNGDLVKLFEIASVREKSLVSLGASLGWAISDVLALDKTYVETLIQRAKDNNEQFIFFHAQRKKTGAKMFGVINPLAVTWLEKWLAINKNDKLFGITADMVNKNLQKLARQAQLKLTGNISFHCFRAWTFSSLIKSGMSEFEAKYLIGKSIPLSDSTYLNLEESIREKYPEVYDKYLNIQPTTTTTLAKNEYVENLEQTIKNQQKQISDLETRLRVLSQDTETSGDSIMKYLDSLEKSVKAKA